MSGIARLSANDSKWQREDDARTLLEAEHLQGPRLQAAKMELRRQAKAAMKVVKKR